jgi:hypothetical protein
LSRQLRNARKSYVRVLSLEQQKLTVGIHRF